MSMAAKDVVDALGAHYARRFHEFNSYAFMTEVKIGPSDKGCLRFDAMALRKSYASPEIIGFEVKRSRADFLNDDKWQGYLRYCNRFYFACPVGLIKAEELPAGIGLVTVGEGGTLSWRKKATVMTKTEDIPGSIFQYMLFSKLDLRDMECPFHAKSRRTEHYLAAVEASKVGGYSGFTGHRKLLDAVRDLAIELKKEKLIAKAEIERAQFESAVGRELARRAGFSIPFYWSGEATASRINLIVDDVIKLLGAPNPVENVDSQLECEELIQEAHVAISNLKRKFKERKRS